MPIMDVEDSEGNREERTKNQVQEGRMHSC